MKTNSDILRIALTLSVGLIDKSELGTYCTQDSLLYIDPSIVDLLKAKGAQGDYILHFVISHEYNHYVQAILGYLDKFVDSPSRELHADCLVGVVIHLSQEQSNANIGELLISFTTTAAAVGDDRDLIEPGRTHPSSSKRVKAWYLGYSSGDKDKCYTSYGNFD